MVGINLKSAFYSKSPFFQELIIHHPSTGLFYKEPSILPPSPHILPLPKKFAFSSGTEQRMVSEQRMKATSSDDSVVVFDLLMLSREFLGMIHWLTINNNPSNPQQPPATPSNPHSLRKTHQ